MQGEEIIKQSAAYRGQKKFDEAIELIESNIENISDDIKLNAWHEAFLAAQEKGDSGLARQYALLIAGEEPSMPSIQKFL
ncbi:hypothetical protein M2124_002033 [Polynucleobacter sphagniphilus]|jgi:hypothetical protein|uniref:hypothetical protein n=1 Tax=Polynucleobacter sphagniphilus TaxID=1743169 RepID=UPI002473F406|nr:hypothetical protein [Polynucleobacter sphagniphilus]MDH6155733.1 hypothetical protein [Polynucleobacter sphagniphilus]